MTQKQPIHKTIYKYTGKIITAIAMLSIMTETMVRRIRTVFYRNFVYKQPPTDDADQEEQLQFNSENPKKNDTDAPQPTDRNNLTYQSHSRVFRTILYSPILVTCNSIIALIDVLHITLTIVKSLMRLILLVPICCDCPKKQHQFTNMALTLRTLIIDCYKSVKQIFGIALAFLWLIPSVIFYRKDQIPLNTISYTMAEAAADGLDNWAIRYKKKQCPDSNKVTTYEVTDTLCSPMCRDAHQFATQISEQEYLQPPEAQEPGGFRMHIMEISSTTTFKDGSTRTEDYYYSDISEGTERVIETRIDVKETTGNEQKCPLQNAEKTTDHDTIKPEETKIIGPEEKKSIPNQIQDSTAKALPEPLSLAV